MFQWICIIHNQQIVNYNKQNGSVKMFIPFPTRTKFSLKGLFNCCLQPAVQKFVGIESCYKIKLGKNIENHLGNLMAIYKEEMQKAKLDPQKNFPNTWMNSCG